MRREKRGGFYGVGFDLDLLNKYEKFWHKASAYILSRQGGDVVMVTTMRCGGWGVKTWAVSWWPEQSRVRHRPRHQSPAAIHHTNTTSHLILNTHCASGQNILGRVRIFIICDSALHINWVSLDPLNHNIKLFLSKFCRCRLFFWTILSFDI